MPCLFPYWLFPIDTAQPRPGRPAWCRRCRPYRSPARPPARRPPARPLDPPTGRPAGWPHIYIYIYMYVYVYICIYMYIFFSNCLLEFCYYFSRISTLYEDQGEQAFGAPSPDDRAAMEAMTTPGRGSHTHLSQQ